jgi:hypothetical protein
MPAFPRLADSRSKPQRCPGKAAEVVSATVGEGFPAERSQDCWEMGEIPVRIWVRPACRWIGAKREHDDRYGLLGLGRFSGRHCPGRVRVHAQAVALDDRCRFRSPIVSHHELMLVSSSPSMCDVNTRWSGVLISMTSLYFAIFPASAMSGPSTPNPTQVITIDAPTMARPYSLPSVFVLMSAPLSVSRMAEPRIDRRQGTQSIYPPVVLASPPTSRVGRQDQRRNNACRSIPLGITPQDTIWAPLLVLSSKGSAPMPIQVWGVLGHRHAWQCEEFAGHRAESRFVRSLQGSRTARGGRGHEPS